MHVSLLSIIKKKKKHRISSGPSSFIRLHIHVKAHEIELIIDLKPVRQKHLSKQEI